MKKLISIFLVSAAITACSSSGPKQPIVSANANQPLSIDDRILVAAESVSNSMRELALIEASKVPKQKLVSNEAPAGLDAKLNVNWSGPIGEFMASAAKLSVGYSLKVRGKQPAIPVIVTINTKNVTLYDLIRDAAVQCGVRANVTIDASDEDNKLIILEYPV